MKLVSIALLSVFFTSQYIDKAKGLFIKKVIRKEYNREILRYIKQYTIILGESGERGKFRWE